MRHSGRLLGGKFRRFGTHCGGTDCYIYGANDDDVVVSVDDEEGARYVWVSYVRI